MKIVIDLQGAQTESRFRGIGRYSISIVKAMLRDPSNHEIIIVLNGLFKDTIESIRADFDGLISQENIRVWYSIGPIRESIPEANIKREIAKVLRRDFFKSLEPDFILITSLFEGFSDDAITSIDSDIPVVAISHDLIPYINKEQYLSHNKLYENFYLRKLEELKKAKFLFANSVSSLNEVTKYLNFPSENIKNIYAAVDDSFKKIYISALDKQELFSKFNIYKPFLLYSGGSDERKNIHRLIEAFSRINKKLFSEHQLVLAGKINIDHKIEFEKIAKKNGLLNDKLIFTGYITDEELIKLYNLTTLFVFPSWHEGFGLPALEAMCCGAATIASNTSSIPEVIDYEEALFDPYSIDSISKKIEYSLQSKEFRKKLIENAKIQSEKFSWDISAKKLITTLEDLVVDKEKIVKYELSDTIREVSSIIVKNDINDTSTLVKLANDISINTLHKINKKTIWIDITQLYMQDYGTGIQRVVRSVISEIYREEIKNYEISLVYLECINGICRYKKALKYEKNFVDKDISNHGDIIEPSSGDIFLGLDLMSWVIEAQKHELFTSWKDRGVLIVFVIYDILPIHHPEWWPDSGEHIHQKWLETIASISDKLICISSSVSEEVQKWVNNNISRLRPIDFLFFHLGADIENSLPSKGLSKDDNSNLTKLKAKKTFLMVGTLEPRKGHYQTMVAFEKLWQDDVDVNLVFVGKEGWLVDELILKLKNHKELNKRLFWLDGISDEYLEKVYEVSTCLIAASEGEGFGLPLIEAAQYKIPIIARDIPVFREVAGEFAYYFKDNIEPKIIVNAVQNWLELYSQSKHPKSDNMPWLTWRESTQQLLKCLDVSIS